MTTTPPATNRPNPASPSKAVYTRPELTRAPPRMAGSVNSGRASSPPMPSSEAAVIPSTALSVSMPAVASILNCTAAPAASPAGSTLVTALEASPAATANRFLVRRTRRCRAKAQAKLADSARNELTSQTGLNLDSWGHAAITRVRLGSTT